MERRASKRWRADLLLFGVLLVLGLLLLALLRLTRTEGAQVVVLVSGQEQARYALSDARTEQITDGTRSNTLVISDGYAWVIDASCPDHLCEQQGKICYNGEMIICLPNQLIVQIEGGETPPVDQTVR